ncbi:signal transducer and activator of transcription 5B isoform X2 [Anthonomus grandis grandis]|uniref:signal transducer and activator of transcription 5B isoform X2 n=1 Tax=Anthonomus grandis grandis TaxID=2921223 RepID=UPI0021666037|nr:signal transducer and activator of transcription 5B isoform X2 [Anthonomus grandis grandis]
MALWAKAQQLPPDSIQLQQIRGLYGDHFPIEVRHYLAHYIEEKFLSTDIENIMTDNTLFEQYATNLVDQFIQEIETKAEEIRESSEYFLTKLKLAEAAKVFKMGYSQNPIQLVHLVRQRLATEMKFLQQAGADFMGMGTGLLSNNAAEVLHKLDDLRRRTQSTSEDTRRLEQEQEAFALQYHECTKISAHIQTLTTQAGQQAEHQKIQYITRKQQLEQDLNTRVSLLVELRLKIAEKLRQTYQLLQQLQTQIIDEELIRWKRDQQLSGNGVPFTSNLDQIQDWCESLAEIIWLNRQQLKEVERLKGKLALQPLQVSDMLPKILDDITQLLSSLVTSTFIIEKQPPQVMKTNTRFLSTVRLLVGGKLNVNMTPPQVKVSIISETQANLLLKNDKLGKNNDSSGEILNSTGTMEYQQTTRQLSVSFRNMQLKKIKRAEKKGTESVMDEKFSLLFQSQFSVGGGELMFHVWTLSLPVVVIVHGNQEPHAWATVTWDNAFSEPGRCPFQVPDKVPWVKIKETLSMKFKNATGRGLNEDHLRFLADKVFRGNYNEQSHQMLSWAQFCKEPLPDRNFTFWEWFFAIMKLTKEHLRNPWVDGAIMGFVKKKTAEELLLNCHAGTFLLRFSDSELGGITIAWTQDSQEVLSIQPFTAKDLPVRSLADRIADISHLVKLYPNIPKADVFAKYYTQYQETSTGPGGYVKPVLVTQVLGVGHNSFNTPHHNSFMSPDPTRDTPSVASSFQSVLDL